eukprot:1139180-Pelagomonas_calceolata.AAC.6
MGGDTGQAARWEGHHPPDAREPHLLKLAFKAIKIAMPLTLSLLLQGYILSSSALLCLAVAGVCMLFVPVRAGPNFESILPAT